MDNIFSEFSQDHNLSGLIIKLRHDFRTPINAIIGYSEMLLEDLETEDNEIISGFQKINVGGHELLSIVNQNLDNSLEKSLKAILGLSPILEAVNIESNSSLQRVIENCQLLKNDQSLTSLIPDIERIEVSAFRFRELLNKCLQAALTASELQSIDPNNQSVNNLVKEISHDLLKKNHFIENQTCHLLVVDDNENNRDLFTRQLQREGYIVTTATNGQEALTMIKTGEYELVLLDLMMPILDGYQALKMLKADEQWQHIPVIMISASDEIDQVVRCIEIGAEDFLPKPFNPILLKARIGAALDKKRFRDRERQYLQQVEIYSQKLNQELEKGRQMQLNFLPPELLQVPNWEISAFFKPARQVAGDFYDTFPVLEKYVGLVIADVCDKGVGAALFMALFRSLIRIFASQTAMRNFYQHLTLDSSGKSEKLTDSSYIAELTPTNVLEAVALTNNYVAEYHGDLGMFATLFFGVLDPQTGILYYINGGHEPLFIINSEGKIEQKLNSTGPAVGMMPNMKFRVEQAQLQAGDILIGYTDGVPEARAFGGEFFTDQKLLNILTKPISSVSQLLTEITENVINHIGEADQFDDITLLAIQRN
ncbi:serine phosphatase RsbU, regulator of sigma subunit [Synechococcus sp. PCC 7502]|uniref:SpoIIE family protein phosphatase n=1 Tax=Synechococcus sp. PCC 7502 TaxID=1173263 RepID=UPI00029F81FB|nr:SpoIIE family protein phosphatase [Synechococcus sp. PCC 7502]AFY73740.1 serine phosphatase RsbU, regulator of sigma subunit [Synechococcus sp. PCC 7502]